MRRCNSIKTTAFILALGLSHSAWALWSPEPTDHMDPDPLSAAAAAPAGADGPKVPLGYTPPVDLRKMYLAVQERSGDPVTRHLAAGEAGEVIETPVFGSSEIRHSGTFTRVNPAKLLDDRKTAAADQERAAAIAGRTADTPIPEPAGYWLLLVGLPALLAARRCLRS